MFTCKRERIEIYIYTHIYIYIYSKSKGKQNTLHTEKRTQKNKKIKLTKKKVEVSSLTCLFVYKVLNQEVLDDRGKFEVSL